MISALLALTLVGGAMQNEAANQARRDYSACLQTFMRASLRERMEPGAFETALATQCSTQAGAYRAAMIARDRRTGGSRERAEEDAQGTIDDARANVLEYYRDYYESNTVPN